MPAFAAQLLSQEPVEIVCTRVETAMRLLQSAIRLQVAGWEGRAYLAGIAEAISQISAKRGAEVTSSCVNLTTPPGDIVSISPYMSHADVAARYSEALACYSSIELDRLLDAKRDRRAGGEAGVVLAAIEQRIRCLASLLPEDLRDEVLVRLFQELGDPILLIGRHCD
jgi:hypothetical protein